MEIEGAHPKWEKYERYVSEIGKWAWIVGILSGVIYIIWGIYGAAVVGEPRKQGKEKCKELGKMVAELVSRLKS